MRGTHVRSWLTTAVTSPREWSGRSSANTDLGPAARTIGHGAPTGPIAISGTSHVRAPRAWDASVRCNCGFCESGSRMPSTSDLVNLFGLLLIRNSVSMRQVRHLRRRKPFLQSRWNQYTADVDALRLALATSGVAARLGRTQQVGAVSGFPGAKTRTGCEKPPTGQ
jgi:hypothetical protein